MKLVGAFTKVLLTGPFAGMIAGRVESFRKGISLMWGRIKGSQTVGCIRRISLTCASRDDKQTLKTSISTALGAVILVAGRWANLGDQYHCRMDGLVLVVGQQSDHRDQYHYRASLD